MQKLALLLASFTLVACSFDRTLDTLVPGNAYGVVLAEQPSLTARLLGETFDLPWSGLDGGKPWAAALLPGTPSAVFVALALADKPSAWSDVETWARTKAGLAASRAGSYAVLTSGPPQDTTKFDLGRVRTGELVSVYIDADNVLAAPEAASFVTSMEPAAVFVRRNLAGLRLSVGTKDGGIVVRTLTDLRAGSPAKRVLKSLTRPDGLATWTGLFPAGDGVRLAAMLPPEAIQAAGGLLNDASWSARWAALSPLLGPGLAVSAVPRPDGIAWAAAVQTRDPQAVRQALKTLVASGDLQKHFTSWSLDADTPVIYQDKPGAELRTQITVGADTVQLAWGTDRVAAAGGTGASDALWAWKRPTRAAVSWFGQVPGGASAVAEGSFGGLGARGALRVLADGNLELSVWADDSEVKAWEAKAPQVLREWLAGAAGSAP